MGVLDRITLHEDYLHVFDSPQGKRVLEHICKKAGVFKSNFDTDSHNHAFREGARWLALAIVRYVKKDHAAFIGMISESMEEDGQ